eukprot:jgi/Galph1/2659/GphlegSOOS_G1374.1
MKRAVSYNDVAAFVAMPLSSKTEDESSSDEETAAKSFPMKKLAIVIGWSTSSRKDHMQDISPVTRVFNVGNYRREYLGASQPAQFFDPTNSEGRKARWELAIKCLDDMIAWRDVKCCERRLEAEDKSIIEHIYGGPNYACLIIGIQISEKAVEDFQKRICKL